MEPSTFWVYLFLCVFVCIMLWVQMFLLFIKKLWELLIPFDITSKIDISSLRLEEKLVLKCRCVYRPLRKKFNIVSKIPNISVLHWKYPFFANLVPKFKFVCLKLNLVPRLIRICKFRWWGSLFLFSTGNILFGQIWSKKSKLSV